MEGVRETMPPEIKLKRKELGLEAVAGQRSEECPEPDPNVCQRARGGSAPLGEVRQPEANARQEQHRERSWPLQYAENEDRTLAWLEGVSN